MELKLSWENSIDGLVPNCSSDVLNKNGVSPLACLLTDDGGQKFLDTVPWLDEGVKRLFLVKNASIEFADWSRDAWGAEFTRERVRIYSLYDDDCFEVVELGSFEMALLAWRSFIQLKPEIGVIQRIKI